MGRQGFSCWTQFVSMLFCQLAHADSLREICNGLRCCLGKLVHLGIRQPPNKSTLAYANQHRPAALFEDLFGTALGRFRHEKQLGARSTQFRFKNKLSLDSTPSRFASACFLGLAFVAPRAGSRPTCCSIMTTTCPPMC